MRFFGRCVVLPDIALTIGARRQVPVVFGTAVRLDDGHIVTDVRPHAIPSFDIPTETRRMAGVFEQFIRRWPDQWLAFQPIFERHG